MADPESIGGMLARALTAYEALTSLGEDVEDEWSYVSELSAAWTERISAVVAERGPEPSQPAVSAAIDRIIDEVGRIKDPHRAIDWLSTFPQVVLVAIGEQP